jgi:hypothetical protein
MKNINTYEYRHHGDPGIEKIKNQSGNECDCSIIVLLAQGECVGMLHAKPNDRGKQWSVLRSAAGWLCMLQQVASD